MIDWLTLIIDASLLNEDARKACRDNVDRIVRISPEGEVRWESVVRESIRSDSHQVTIKFGATLQICGSPARIKNCNNVFGSLDIQQCALDMITFAATHYKIFIPKNLKMWRCSKIDVTQNFDLGSLEQVKQAVDYFKPLKIGRQKTSTEDTTVMWGKGSALHMGKIYAKGPHARKMVNDKNASYTEIELQKADRLIRVEYSIRRLLIRRIHESSGLEWHQFTPEFLLSLHSQYFSKFISDIEVVDMDNVLNLLLDNVGKDKTQIPTEGRAKAAYDCYVRCRTFGFHVAREGYPKSTWNKHLHYLGTIGLGAADLQPLNVVPLRRRQIVLDQPVSSWDDIKLAQRA
ncbi:MAG TPA: phage/plasmid replication protein, II/X family [Pedobacter sp.]